MFHYKEWFVSRSRRSIIRAVRSIPLLSLLLAIDQLPCWNIGSVDKTTNNNRAAYMTPETSEPSFLISIVPLFLVGLIWAAIALWLAPRKGKSRWFALLMLIPMIGPFGILYLLALTDQKIIDEIENLKRRLGQGGDSAHLIISS